MLSMAVSHIPIKLCSNNRSACYFTIIGQIILFLAGSGEELLIKTKIYPGLTLLFATSVPIKVLFVTVWNVRGNMI